MKGFNKLGEIFQYVLSVLTSLFPKIAKQTNKELLAMNEKESARATIRDLVARFRMNRTSYLADSYNETQARTDFITPLIQAFGWDVNNSKNLTQSLREVLEEATVEVGDGDEKASKRPDYELRLERQRKLFVEAKKPSVNISSDKKAAFQARRYGFSAGMPISVLTNFDQLVVFDCTTPPCLEDAATHSRRLIVSYEELEAKFDDLWPLLSREAVYSGDFDRRFDIGIQKHGSDQFDELFLDQVRKWRELLAKDIHATSPQLTSEELTYVVQLFLSRIVFLRICEDREIEAYETLKSIGSEGAFNALKEQLKRADAFYDSGLFRLADDAKLNLQISDKTLSSIVGELYYPQSPYTFAVVETEVLGEIYERFLGDVITIDNGQVSIENKPEVRASGGVVPTPRYIVDRIVAETLGPAIEGKSPDDLNGMSVLDPCCGSGIFLLSAYEQLQDHYLGWYIGDGTAKHLGKTIYEGSGNQWKLTLDEKRRILTKHLRGVDIDANAGEVAKFSLLLKLIEDQSKADLEAFVAEHNEKALPALDNVIQSGNSLVSTQDWQTAMGNAMSNALIAKVKPLNWPSAFQAELESGGFDVILANPPYIRIQTMAAYSPEEVEFYQAADSPYTTARKDNFDKYSLFIERCYRLAKPTGRIGMIVPHKFMNTNAGEALRCLLTAPPSIERIIHFGAKQVFGMGISNYTCILVLNRTQTGSIELEQLGQVGLESWKYGQVGTITHIVPTDLGEEKWGFASSAAQVVFDKIKAASPMRLRDVADIEVGVQTSADPIYILHPFTEDHESVKVERSGTVYRIEKAILRPCLHDVQLHAYEKPKANAWMIFPYRIIKNNTGKLIAQLIQPSELKQKFPDCLAYLEAHKVALEQRNITGGTVSERQYYQFGRSQSLVKFNAPKIILPVLSLEPRYAYDPGNMLFTGGGNGPYYMVRSKVAAVSDFALLALLNHPFSEALVRSNTSVFRGGYYSHGKQFIRDLPVPTLTSEQRHQLDKLVQEVIKLQNETGNIPQQERIRETQLKTRMKDVEEFISARLGLTPDDMAVIRSVPVPE